MNTTKLTMKNLDGITAVVNAIAISIGNLRKTPDGLLLNTEQADALIATLMHLFIHPLIDMDTAVELVLELDKVGLRTDPKILGLLLDVLEDIDDDTS